MRTKSFATQMVGFRGFTSVDCYLETESLVFLIEGKRTESVSAATIWYPRRNQLLRNLEVAMAAAGGKKDYAVLLCSERPMFLTEEDWIKSYPHLNGHEIAELKRHLGYVLWSDIVRHLCPTLTLPHDVDEAIQRRRVLLGLDRADRWIRPRSRRGGFLCRRRTRNGCGAQRA